MTLAFQTVPGEQGSAEWLAARAGKITASRMADVMDFTKKGEPSAKRQDYLLQIVAERLTGQPCEDTYITQAMRWGTEQEPYARVAYELARGVVVHQVGLVLHPSIPNAAASPDGVVNGEGLIEIKCPGTTTHLRTMLDGMIPEKYLPQINWQMACTGAKWCDFVSFDPRLPDEYQLFIIRLMRDENAIAACEDSALKFLGEVDAMLAKLEGK